MVIETLEYIKKKYLLILAFFFPFLEHLPIFEFIDMS